MKDRDYKTELTDLEEELNLDFHALEADTNKILCEKYRQELKILNEGARTHR